MPAFPAVPSFLKAAEILAVHEAAFRCMHYRPLEIHYRGAPPINSLLGVRLWLVYGRGGRQARKPEVSLEFGWVLLVAAGLWLIPAGPLDRLFGTKYGPVYLKKNPRPRVQLLARPG